MKKYYLIFVIILSFLLLSCDPPATYEFCEGTYEYQGDEFAFYDDILIDDVKIKFYKIDEESKENVIRNKKNGECYEVSIYFKKKDDENFYYCPFERIEARETGNQYYIMIDFSNVIDNLMTKVSIVCSGNNKNEDEEKSCLAYHLHMFFYQYIVDDVIQDCDPKLYIHQIDYVEDFQ